MAAKYHTVVIATDKNNVIPCCYTVYSMLEQATKPIHLHILGLEITKDDLAPLQAVVDTFEATKMSIRIVNPNKIKGARRKTTHITNTTYTRLLIPQYFDETVLSLDTDLLIRDDVTKLWDIPLWPNSMGAVVDSNIVATHYSQLAAKNLEDPITKGNAAFLDDIADTVGFDAPTHCFNAGVLLLDCKAIKEDRALYDQYGDVKGAAALKRMTDNGWLMRISYGKVTFLPPEWNSLRGNLTIMMRFVPDHVREHFRKSNEDPAIVHFSGRNKPYDTERTESYLLDNPYLGEFRQMMARCDATLKKHGF